MKAQFVVRQKNGISFHRWINPMSYLILNEGDTLEMLWHKEDESRINCDILMYSLFLETDAKWLAKLKKDGTKIILDVDDYWEISPKHPHYANLKQARYTERVIENIKIADVVICTTLRLQEQIRKYNKNTVVIPNAFPYDKENYHANNKVPSDRARFMYVGGSTHLNDIKLLEGKFRRIASDNLIKDNSTFILAGYEQAKAKRYLTWEDQRQNNENYKLVDVQHGQWDRMLNVFNHTGVAEVLPSTDPEHYIEFYDHADVALVPLESTTWNSYKSPLKLAEAATRNIPVICSAVAPYTDVANDIAGIQDIPGVMWVNNSNDWLAHIRKCIKDPSYRQAMGEQLGAFCREHYSLEKWNEVRKQVIYSLC